MFEVFDSFRRDAADCRIECFSSSKEPFCVCCVHIDAGGIDCGQFCFEECGVYAAGCSHTLFYSVVF